MPVRKFLARDFRFDISEDNRATWTEISGLSTWSFETDNNEEDTATIDNGAWGSSMYTQRTGSMSLEGFWLVDSATGTRDPGQSKVESAAVQVGYAAYRDFRVRAMPSGYGEIGHFVFTGQAGIGERGGSVTDVMPFNVDLIFEGKPVGSGVFSYFN